MDDDWRLTGQERYLRGVTLVKKRWRMTRPNWNHDHCEFCWAKFSFQPGDLHAGFTTPDEYHWICDTCCQDFREAFAWVIAADDDSDA